MCEVPAVPHRRLHYGAPYRLQRGRLRPDLRCRPRVRLAGRGVRRRLAVCRDRRLAGAITCEVTQDVESPVIAVHDTDHVKSTRLRSGCIPEDLNEPQSTLGAIVLGFVAGALVIII